MASRSGAKAARRLDRKRAATASARRVDDDVGADERVAGAAGRGEGEHDGAVVVGAAQRHLDGVHAARERLRLVVHQPRARREEDAAVDGERHAAGAAELPGVRAVAARDEAAARDDGAGDRRAERRLGGEQHRHVIDTDHAVVAIAALDGESGRPEQVPRGEARAEPHQPEGERDERDECAWHHRPASRCAHARASRRSRRRASDVPTATAAHKTRSGMTSTR